MQDGKHDKIKGMNCDYAVRFQPFSRAGCPDECFLSRRIGSISKGMSTDSQHELHAVVRLLKYIKGNGC